jgi:hypothetical protein
LVLLLKDICNIQFFYITCCSGKKFDYVSSNTLKNDKKMAESKFTLWNAEWLNVKNGQLHNLPFAQQRLLSQVVICNFK